MADLKISQLNSLAGTSLANNDVLAIVDTSASETKKITSVELVRYGYGLISTGTLDGDIIEAGTTSARGTIQLTDSTSSTSTTTAATPSSVKTTYDLANAALPASGGTIDGSLIITSDLTVQGTTTTIDTTTLVVQDKNIEMGVVGTPTDVTADGGGITLKGATDKTINWVNATDAWTSSERFDFPAGTEDAPSIILNGDIDTGLYSPGADQVAISTNGTQRVTIDNAGRLLVGTATSIASSTSVNAGLQNQSNGANAASNFGRWSADAIPYIQFFSKSRGTSVGSHGVVNNNDFIGNLAFEGSDGTAFVRAANIAAQVDGIPGQTAGTFAVGIEYRILTTGTTDFTLIGAADSNPETVFTATGVGTGTGTAIRTAGDMPGRLVFSTTAANTGSPAERMRITSDGKVGLGTSAPGTKLVVQEFSDFTLNSNTIDYTVFLEGGLTQGNGNYGASLGFNRIGDANRTGAVIAAKQTTADPDQVGIAFLTHAGAATNIDLTEQMLITHDGYVGIGTASPQSNLHITDTSTNNPTIRFEGGVDSSTPSQIIGTLAYYSRDSSGDGPQVVAEITGLTGRGSTASVPVFYEHEIYHYSLFWILTFQHLVQ